MYLRGQSQILRHQIELQGKKPGRVNDIKTLDMRMSTFMPAMIRNKESNQKFNNP